MTLRDTLDQNPAKSAGSPQFTALRRERGARGTMGRKKRERRPARFLPGLCGGENQFTATNNTLLPGPSPFYSWKRETYLLPQQGSWSLKQARARQLSNRHKYLHIGAFRSPMGYRKNKFRNSLLVVFSHIFLVGRHEKRSVGAGARRESGSLSWSSDFQRAQRYSLHERKRTRKSEVHIVSRPRHTRGQKCI